VELNDKKTNGTPVRTKENQQKQPQNNSSRSQPQNIQALLDCDESKSTKIGLDDKKRLSHIQLQPRLIAYLSSMAGINIVIEAKW
jgi:hypothetical protein